MDEKSIKKKKALIAAVSFAVPAIGIIIWMVQRGKDKALADTAIRWTMWGIVAIAAALVIPFLFEYNAVEKMTKG